MTTTTVYVELLDEGVQVWRPTEAEVLGEGRYRLIAGNDYDEGSETWAFVPGTVECSVRRAGPRRRASTGRDGRIRRVLGMTPYV